MSDFVESEAEVDTDEELDKMSGSGDEAPKQISEDEDEEEEDDEKIAKDLGALLYKTQIIMLSLYVVPFDLVLACWKTRLILMRDFKVLCVIEF